MIERYFQNLEELLKPNRALIIYGPRRVGKTTLLTNFLNQTKLKYKLDSGDNVAVQQTLSSQLFSKILEYASGFELIAIDEAQQIPNIGMAIKILVDQVPNIKVIATGSSSFDLRHQIGEPLTGRKITLVLYPILQVEFLKNFNKYELEQKLPDFLVFGSYPEVITAINRQDKIDILNEIVNSYLLKDILTFEKLNDSLPVSNLLKLLAFQVGSEVSISELATQLGINNRTVERYLDLLEKSFIITRLGAYSGNLRKELTGKFKYYFLDNGVRNALINQFNDLTSRNDIGQLWENFIMMERIKFCSYKKISANRYFWRTYDQKEIDLIEERDGKLYGFEFKWKQEKAKSPKDFLKAYSNSEYKIINNENYLDFIT